MKRAFNFLHKLVFKYFQSVLFSFSVQFIWHEDNPYLIPVRGFKIVGFYLNQIVAFTQIPIFVFNLHQRWPDYMEHKHYLQMVFHCTWIILMLCCSTYQTSFFTQKGEIISLVNQTVLLRKYFEKSKSLSQTTM